MLKTFGTLLLVSALILTAGGCVGNNNSSYTANQSTNNTKLITSYTTSPDLNNILQNFVESYAENYYFSAISANVKCGANQISGIAGNLESNISIPINTNSLFQIGSTSKSFTSVVILQLANDPKYHFSLNDTIGKWFKNTDGSLTYPQWENVTVIQLLNMSSGIPDYVNDTFEVIEKSLINPTYYFYPSELVATVESMPIIFAPGKGFHYSNTNYVLLGMLIQKVTGNSPITEIKNRIFNKLNMTHTYFPENLPSNVIPVDQMTNGYVYFDFLPDPLNGFYNRTWSSLSLYYTAGGIISTPEDLAKYTQALYHAGYLLTESQIKDLTTTYMIAQSPTAGFPNGGQPISEVTQNISVGYGLGIFNIYGSEPLGSYYMYNGATLGFGSYYAYYPKKDMYTSFMINNGVNLNNHTQVYQDLVNSINRYTINTQCK